jgi:vacuolar-type H+-ATPase subunit H
MYIREQKASAKAMQDAKAQAEKDAKKVPTETEALYQSFIDEKGRKPTAKEWTDRLAEGKKKETKEDFTEKDALNVLENTFGMAPQKYQSAYMKYGQYREGGMGAREAVNKVLKGGAESPSAETTGSVEVPKGARTGTWKGMRVYSTDGGKTLYDMTGKKVK